MSTYDYNALCDAYKAVLNGIVGLRGHATIPDTVETPCAIVAIADDGPADDFEGKATVNLKVLLLVSKADTNSGQRKLNSYRSRGHAESIADRLEASPSPADYVVWTGTSEPSRFEIGGIEYAGVEMGFEAAVG